MRTGQERAHAVGPGEAHSHPAAQGGKPIAMCMGDLFNGPFALEPAEVVRGLQVAIGRRQELVASSAYLCQSVSECR